MWFRRPPAAPARHTRFDAVIDLGPSITSDRAAEAVMSAAETAVHEIPGATRVRVRFGTGPAAVSAKLFAPGRTDQPSEAPWPTLKANVEAAATAAAERVPRAHPPAFPTNFPIATPSTTGFSEAPQHLDALEALAALAQSVRPAPPSDDGDVDALANLLGFILPEDAQGTARLAIRRFGSYPAVLAAPEHELRIIPGLGTHSVAAIKLVHEAAIRLARAGVTGAPVLDDPVRLAAYLSAAVGRARVEQFRILFLDNRGMLRADEVQATGTVNHTPVYPREVVRRALELGAAAIILVHNHPSGDPTPSADDLTMTESIERAASAVGIAVRDHVIVGNGRVLSFREAGLINEHI